MNEYNNIRNQACPNEECPLYGVKVPNKVVIHSLKDSRFQCSECKKTWVGHRESFIYRLHSPKDKVELARLLIAGGVSVRKAAKEVCVSPSTVQRWKSFIL
ncbi:MAG: helix-turn-helix domain-containing protein [Patescibacteria group bacterium]|nr:helix-turn-helix domain-containing protein [Patescibacteria group bacterium]